MTRRVISAAVLTTLGCGALTDASSSELERERIDRDNHDPLFPVASGVHDGMDCNDCHGAFDTFTRFTCMSCKSHDQSTMDGVHSGFASYSFVAERCLECHPTGESLSRAAHQTFFPIVEGPHKEIDCADCHDPGFAGFSCIGCHTGQHRCAAMDEKHTEVGGYACQDVRCLECHPSGRSD